MLLKMLVAAEQRGSHAVKGREFVGLTRYSKTSVSDLSVWTMSCSVTMLACFKSFSNETKDTEEVDGCNPTQVGHIHY